MQTNVYFSDVLGKTKDDPSKRKRATHKDKGVQTAQKDKEDKIKIEIEDLTSLGTLVY